MSNASGKEPVYIKLFLDYLDALEPFSDAERGRLFTALLSYGRTGEAPQLNGNERFLFPMMKAQIDRDFAAWREKEEHLHDVRSDAGSKGAKARANKNMQNRQNEANQANESKPEQTQHKTKTTDEDYRLLTTDNDDMFPPMPPGGGPGMPDADASVKKTGRKRKSDRPSVPKTAYAEFVTMTEAEHQKLIDRYGPEKTARMIEILDNYKGSKGVWYESDYRACLSWVAERVEEEQQQGGNHANDGNGEAYHAGGTAYRPKDAGANAGEREISPDERWGIKSVF